MLLLYIFLIVLLFSSVPYIVLLAKRSGAAAEIRNALNRSGCEFRCHGIWYMAGIEGRRADFHVLRGNRVIAVKVIGFLSAGTALHLESPTEYRIKKLKPSETDAPISTYKKQKKHPYDFKAGLPSEWSGLPMAKVILVMDPYPAKLTRSAPSGEIRLHVGDDAGEAELYDTVSFIGLFN